MPTYSYSGTYTAIFAVLRAGVTAEVVGKELPKGQPIVLQPGEQVKTTTPFEHPLLVEVPEEPMPKKHGKSAPDLVDNLDDDAATETIA